MAGRIVVGLTAEGVAFEFRDPGQWIPDLVAGAERRLEQLAGRLGAARVPTTNVATGQLLAELEAQLADTLESCAR